MKLTNQRFLTKEDLHDQTMFYCIKSRCSSIIRKISNEKLLKINFIIQLSRIQCVNVVAALTMIGLESAGMLFARIQSCEPLISKKSYFVKKIGELTVLIA